MALCYSEQKGIANWSVVSSQFARGQFVSGQLLVAALPLPRAMPMAYREALLF